MSNTFDYVGLGSFLKRHRMQKDLTIEDVERELGADRAFLERLEAGEVKPIRIESILVLSQLYEFSLDDLLQFSSAGK